MLKLRCWTGRSSEHLTSTIVAIGVVGTPYRTVRRRIIWILGELATGIRIVPHSSVGEHLLDTVELTHWCERSSFSATQSNGHMATSTIQSPSKSGSVTGALSPTQHTPRLDDISTLDYVPTLEAVVDDNLLAESESCSYADDVLQRIDDTLDLIAEAQHVAAGNAPITSFDISIIVPVYNARESLPEVLARIDEVMPMSCEVIVVDDGSTDGSWHFARGLMPKSNLKVLHRRKHHGRGSAIRMALRHTTGRVVAIQDADMAYDPADLLGAIWPILEEKADAVYGSRRLRRDTRRGISLASRLSGRITTLIANLATGMKISDMESSHKVFNGDLIRSLELRECDRGFDAEVTAKVARRAKVVMEVPTSFEGEFLDEQFRPSFSTLMQTVRGLIRYRAA
ncbi:glycosyltransferase family 2 protein [Aporhodopirellula aestuarii]|uniref:Glycosyltransferase family 2 protein n=1 Tax=Aporhodopirellula aestuarii TaxID=2950107 RepID=A0ABT0U6F7_9BACT|nr:glycosyltransferase family 2 protein [Aporhodopirellula aestuarii]MCM2372426.1 glycosyltransferase family 2 protein [Aporhodopirellula aestuarii]